MYPRLFELGPDHASTPTASCWPPPTCSGLKLAMVRARKRAASMQTRVLDLGIYIIISALVGAKLLLLVTDFQTFTAQPARAARRWRARAACSTAG